MSATADVYGLLHALNDEIYQASAALSDSVHLRLLPEEERWTREANVAPVVSAELLSLIRRAVPTNELGILQIALQCAFVHMAHDMISAWIADSPEENREIERLHELMKQQGTVLSNIHRLF
jgi:hypothetical protein